MKKSCKYQLVIQNYSNQKHIVILQSFRLSFPFPLSIVTKNNIRHRYSVIASKNSILPMSNYRRRYLSDYRKYAYPPRRNTCPYNNDFFVGYSLYLFHETLIKIVTCLHIGTKQEILEQILIPIVLLINQIGMHFQLTGYPLKNIIAHYFFS